MLHVEIVQNEWSSARQRVVARLRLSDGSVAVEHTGSDDHWSEVALRPFMDRESGMEVAPETDPERFLRALHHHLRGDYLFATEAHEDGDCEFTLGEDIPLKVTDTATDKSEVLA